MVLNKREDQLSQLKECVVVNEEILPFCSSSQEVYINFVRGFCVSSCGDKVWAGHIQKKENNKHILKLMMYDFKKESHFFYDYEHDDSILSVLVSEVFGLAMSGGRDKTLVLHDLETMKMIKIFNMKYGSLRCLFDLGTAVAVGDLDTVRFLDLETREMDQFEVKAEGKFITCMNLSIGGIDQKDKISLLVGRRNSNKIDKISIPKAISENGREILEIKNGMKNAEKFMKKMFDLKNENKKLWEENQRLKDMLKKEEEGKVDLISKFEEKIIDLSNKVKKQETINAQLKEGLQQVKNQLTTIRSKTRKDAAQTNFLIYHALNKHRRQKINTKIQTQNTNLDDSLIQGHPHLPTKVKELKRTVSNQLDQIHALRLETNRLRNMEQDHWKLREDFDRLDGYLKWMTKNNKMVKEIR